MILFGTISLLAARLIGTTQLYQLGYALAGLLLSALVLGLFLSRGLGYARRVSAEERFVAGHTSRVDLVVSNSSRRQSPGVEVVEYLPERRLLETPPIGGSGTRTIRTPVLFARRGLYELGPAQLQATDPFGLLRFVRRFGTRTQVTVYPEVFDLWGLSFRGQSRETGTLGSSAQQWGDEFSGLREYRRGDDRRHIHWKSVARTGELIVKEFAQDAPRRQTVILDLHRKAGAPATEVEDAVSAAGSILRYLAREGLPFRLLCTDKERGATAFGEDETSYWRAMRLLATVRADGDTNTGDFLDEKLREGREELGEGVALISRALDEAVVESVRRLRTAGLSATVVALAAHTYRAGGAPPASTDAAAREAALSGYVRRLESVGADVRVVRRPGGVAALAREWETVGFRGAL